MTYTHTCTVCGIEFESRSPKSKYCREACRTRHKRSAPAAPTRNLVAAVQRELDGAGVADSYLGQLALEIARQMTSDGASAVASSSKELRTVMASALSQERPDPGRDEADGESVADDRDELDRMHDELEERRRARQATG